MTVTVTRRSKPVLAILSWEDYEAIMETMEILSDEHAMRDLYTGIQDLREGRAIPWDKAKKHLAPRDGGADRT